MQFSSYQAFRVAFLKLAEGDDVGEANFSIDTADLMIGLGEARVYRDLRASSMVAPLSITPVSSIYTLPADLIELKELYFDVRRPIEIVSIEELRRLGALSSDGSAVYAAQNGEKLEFWPASTTGAVIGSYYAKPAALNAITWNLATTFARYPELFLYAALESAMGFLGFDEQIPKYERLYALALQNAISEEHQRVYGGSPMRMRAR